MNALHQAKEWADRRAAVVVPDDATRVDVAFAQIKARKKVDLKSLATLRSKAIGVRDTGFLDDQAERQRKLGFSVSHLFDRAPQHQGYGGVFVSVNWLPQALRIFNNPDSKVRRFAAV
jgi:hypothetical protein